tara:strand:- start:494 stop:943 length:450 start_codon:yes stop_codon:yes gene_type:complete
VDGHGYSNDGLIDYNHSTAQSLSDPGDITSTNSISKASFTRSATPNFLSTKGMPLSSNKFTPSQIVQCMSVVISQKTDNFDTTIFNGEDQQLGRDRSESPTDIRWGESSNKKREGSVMVLLCQSPLCMYLLQPQDLPSMVTTQRIDLAK